jgi:peptidyl-dipeptidase Dcp
VARDFVEYPSQVNEMWASEPEVLANYARHHETGAPIPVEMVERIIAAGKWNQGYELGELLEAALLDMEWHALTPQQAAAIAKENEDGAQRSGEGSSGSDSPVDD